MQHYVGQAFTDLAKPAGNANITVKTAGTNNNATIYSDDGITAKSNPFVADSLGHFDFYAASGKYDITISGTQVTTYTLANQVLFDPFEISAGDTLFQANALVPLNIADQGGIWGVSIRIPETATLATAGVTGNNVVSCFQFTIPYAVQIGKITFTINNGAAGTGDVGLYSMAGNRLLSTGGFSTSVGGTFTVAVNPAVTINAGHYFFAQAVSNATGFAMIAISGNTTLSSVATILNNQTNKKWGTAANAASSGVLPSSLGAITANITLPPWAVFFER